MRANSRMRILLQQKNNGQYFKESGVWTTSAAEAMDFLSSMKAIAYCNANHLSGVQLVLKFDEQPYEIVLPVLSERRMARAH